MIFYGQCKNLSSKDVNVLWHLNNQFGFCWWIMTQSTVNTLSIAYFQIVSDNKHEIGVVQSLVCTWAMWSEIASFLSCHDITLATFDSATSTGHWWQLRLGKHNYIWTWTFQIELGEEWSQKSIETWNTGCIDVNVIVQSSNEKYGLGYNFWHLKIDQKPEGFAFGVGWWLSALRRESK